MNGLITKSTGSWYLIQGADGTTYQGRLRGKLRLEGFKTTNPVTVGDRVLFEVENKEKGTAIIKDIQERENYITRKSVHKSGHKSLIAANIDQAILIVSLKKPRTSPGFIDRFIVSAECFRIPVIIVFNKADLLNERQLSKYEEVASVYEKIGYPCLLTSATENRNTKAFHELLKGNVSLLSGNSGVGKSSLLNAVSPGLALKTNEVSKSTGKGLHTTTYSEMYSIDQDSHIIDTPGIRELGFDDIEKTELSHYFTEMRPFLGKCKFNNCTHTHEPGCEVVKAVENGTIAPERYQSYLNILASLD